MEDSHHLKITLIFKTKQSTIQRFERKFKVVPLILKHASKQQYEIDQRVKEVSFIPSLRKSLVKRKKEVCIL